MPWFPIVSIIENIEEKVVSKAFFRPLETIVSRNVSDGFQLVFEVVS